MWAVLILIILFVASLTTSIFSYRISFGYSTGNAAYVCWPILLKKQYLEVEHLGSSRFETHFLPVSKWYAKKTCHLTAIE